MSFGGGLGWIVAGKDCWYRGFGKVRKRVVQRRFRHLICSEIGVFPSSDIQIKAHITRFPYQIHSFPVINTVESAI